MPFNISLSSHPQERISNSKLKFERGHRYAIIGPSGCGKSTLLVALTNKSVWPSNGFNTIEYIPQNNALQLTTTSTTTTNDTDDNQSVKDYAMFKAGMLNRTESSTMELKQWGFTTKELETPYKELSGGWKNRLALALSFFSNPDVLLTDEVTNGIDIIGLRTIEKRLCVEKDEDQNIVIPEMEDIVYIFVTHDRAFIANVATDIIYWNNLTQRFEQFSGGFDDWQETIRQKKITQRGRLKAAEKQKEQMESFIHEAQKNKSSNDPNKQRAAASRVEKKMDRIGAYRDDGKKYKKNALKVLSEDALRLPSQILDEKAQILKQDIIPIVRFKFAPATLRRSNGPFLSLNNVSLQYVSASQPLLTNVTLSITPKTRAALIGCNGAGKSLLMNGLNDDVSGKICQVILQPTVNVVTSTISSINKRTLSSKKKSSSSAIATTTTTPNISSIHRDPSLKIAYLSQTQMDQLPLESTPVEIILSYLSGSSKTEHGARQFLGGMSITGDLAKTKVRVMSGGQRMRLAMAVMFAKDSSFDLLLLDEPTTALDLESIEGLGKSLRHWKGALVVSSHDRRFLTHDLNNLNEIWVIKKNGTLEIERIPNLNSDDNNDDHRSENSHHNSSDENDGKDNPIHDAFIEAFENVKL
jgi:ATPase subunit of ABC transporter with duplicated ATPase domains